MTDKPTDALRRACEEAAAEYACKGNAYAASRRAMSVVFERHLTPVVQTLVQAAAAKAAVEIATLRGRLHTIGMAGEFGETTAVVNRIRELECTNDQAKQYIQHAQEREHHRSECEANTEAAVLAMREECAKEIARYLMERGDSPREDVEPLLSGLEKAVRSLPVPTDALERERLKARIDEWRDAVVFFLSPEFRDAETMKRYIKSHSEELNAQLAALSKQPVEQEETSNG